jgi:tetratricopeptide (TPR) repeat protein
MAVRIVMIFVLVAVLWSGAAFAQNQPASYSPKASAFISGKILADGSPVRLVNQEIEVRLEKLDASLAGLGYTRGSYDFTIVSDTFDPNENYFLVIHNPEYKELRYPLDASSFSRRALEGDNFYKYNQIILLDLVSVNPKGNTIVSRNINGQAIPSSIPETAVKEYSEAVEQIKQNNNAAAIAHLEKAVELAPNYFEFVNRLGVAYLKAGKYEQAEEMLVRASTLNPKDASSRINLGIIFVNQGEKQIASASSDPLIDLDLDDQKIIPGEPSFRKAVVVLEEASKLDLSSTKINFYLGMADYYLGEYTKAEPLLQNALLLDRQMQDAQLTLINLYKQQKRYDAALQQIETYLATNPNTPQREQLEKIKTWIKTLPDRK